MVVRSSTFITVALQKLLKTDVISPLISSVVDSKMASFLKDRFLSLSCMYQMYFVRMFSCKNILKYITHTSD